MLLYMDKKTPVLHRFNHQQRRVVTSIYFATSSGKHPFVIPWLGEPATLRKTPKRSLKFMISPTTVHHETSPVSHPLSSKLSATPSALVSTSFSIL